MPYFYVMIHNYRDSDYSNKEIFRFYSNETRQKKSTKMCTQKKTSFETMLKYLPFLSYFKSDGISFLFSTWGSLLKQTFIVLFSEFGHFQNFTFQFQNNTKSNVKQLFELQIVRVFFLASFTIDWSNWITASAFCIK